jgi:pyrroloquinoline quinone (PQQ) biosynthesis protein C
MSKSRVIEGLDAECDDFARRCRAFTEDMTANRAKMFVLQHRQNTRYRNSVLKLRVATNCPEWDVKLGIIAACTEEIIADNEHGGGQPHWKILEELGVTIGLDRDEIRTATPLASTQLSWSAWEGLMSNTHWLKGLIANTCAERINIPGYGDGEFREKGWFGMERRRWQEIFDLSEDELFFFKLHSVADIAHSDLGWNTAGEYAEKLHMEDEVIEACRVNLIVWENYLNGIMAGGDAMDG